MELKTSSEQRQFNTGSVRDSAIGKPRIDLIPTSTLIKLGIHYANGASHYGDNNWKRGNPSPVILLHLRGTIINLKWA